MSVCMKNYFDTFVNDNRPEIELFQSILEKYPKEINKHYIKMNETEVEQWQNQVTFLCEENNLNPAYLFIEEDIYIEFSNILLHYTNNEEIKLKSVILLKKNNDDTLKYYLLNDRFELIIEQDKKISDDKKDSNDIVSDNFFDDDFDIEPSPLLHHNMTNDTFFVYTDFKYGIDSNIENIAAYDTELFFKIFFECYTLTEEDIDLFKINHDINIAEPKQKFYKAAIDIKKFNLDQHYIRNNKNVNKL